MNNKIFDYLVIAWIIALVSLGLVYKKASEEIEEQMKQVETMGPNSP